MGALERQISQDLKTPDKLRQEQAEAGRAVARADFPLPRQDPRVVQAILAHLARCGAPAPPAPAALT